MKTIYPLVSIVISNYNGVKLNILQECLESFKNLDYPNYELILVDNASTDNSTKIAARILGKNPRFKIIKNPVNMYSQGLNLGMQASKGEYIAYFNNDVVIEKKYFQRLIDAFDKYPKLALAQGKLLWYFDHSIIDSAGETMDIFGNPVTIGYKIRDTHDLDKEEYILSASGSACILKKAVLKDIGMYASGYGIGYEDMDLALRLRQGGFEVMRIPSAVCYHRRGSTDLSAMVRIKARWHFNKNRLSTMIRNYPLFLLFQTIPAAVLIYIGSFIWEGLTGKNFRLALTRLQAIIWVVANLPKLIAERKRIRKGITKRYDEKIFKLFAKADIKGKIKAVVSDKIQYSLPWSYPAEIRRLMPENSSILDVGCGDGYLMSWINYKGDYRVIGVDINKADLQQAEKRLTENKKNIYQDVLSMNLTKQISFKKKFDVVLCSQVIEHLEKKDAFELIQKIEKIAKKRIIVATINGFFQFNHRVAGKHDVHLSGWSPGDFSPMGYKVQGSGLKFIYKPGSLKDHSPKFIHPLLFLISYISSPLLRIFRRPALFLIAYKDIR